jgi:hypothetical protein
MARPRKVCLEVDMRITLLNDWRRETNIKTTRTGGAGGSGQKVTVRYEPAPQRKETSAFSWFEEVTVDWSETFLSRVKKVRRKGGQQ